MKMEIMYRHEIKRNEIALKKKFLINIFYAYITNNFFCIKEQNYTVRVHSDQSENRKKTWFRTANLKFTKKKKII